jgi:hypothetical protein
MKYYFKIKNYSKMQDEAPQNTSNNPNQPRNNNNSSD